MSSDPGWKTDPINPQRLRYWDGEDWTDDTAAINPTDQTTHPAPPKNNTRKWLWASAIATVILISSVSVAAVFGLPSLVAALSTNTSAPPTPTPSPGGLSQDSTDEEIEEYIANLPPLVDSHDTSEDESTNVWMEDQGYTTAVSGNVYVRSLESSEFTCGWLNCTYYAVYTEKGCPGGVFVEGSIDSNGVSVGLVNELTASLGSQEQALVGFEDYTDLGDGFRITRVTCHP